MCLVFAIKKPFQSVGQLFLHAFIAIEPLQKLETVLKRAKLNFIRRHLAYEGTKNDDTNEWALGYLYKNTSESVLLVNQETLRR
ncbi:hypothetical protein BOVATA_043430 [Babesia ovata]|uniref:Uncharacterized protein n=1 Tax=Babesia ovata TaxID=189622 RepID=A0A2H6KIN2_9APIC|nr:uncharacterized protein BOVATA_043430 [Babesia ovata]GBE62850.1 hypothetical protein BOVATA_043430 [Babesia ovata]